MRQIVGRGSSASPRRMVVLSAILGLGLAGGLIPSGGRWSGPLPAARAQADPSTGGQWSSVQSWPIVAIHAHLLPTGKVMFFSDDDARLWDPATNGLTAAALAGYNIFCAGHALLADGRLIVTGGTIGQNHQFGEPRASTYDPSTDAWARLPDMGAGRWYPTSTALANGDLLVLGGTVTDVEQNRRPEVLGTGAKAAWRSLTNAEREFPFYDEPYYPFMFLAPNGKAFNAGPNQDTQYLDTSGSGAWSAAGLGKAGLNGFGFRGYGSAALYGDGKVLIVGGGDPPTASAEVIDLTAATPTWRAVNPMANPRRQHNATLLPDGAVLVTGGTSGPGFNNSAFPLHSAERWDPLTEGWTTLASNSTYRGYHSITLLLPDGRVLSAGGNGQPNAEVYSPPYLFKGPRPTITAAPPSVAYGQPFFVETPDAASIAGVTWIRLASVTHAFDQNQRINHLSFTRTTDGLNVTAPANGNLSPPGHYLLFILDGNGVPAVAPIVHLVAPAALIPAAPAGLTARATTRRRISLAWTDRAGNEDGVRIERSTDGASFTPIATLPANTNRYVDTRLARNTPYTYRIRAFNAAGDSAASNTVSATTRGR